MLLNVLVHKPSGWTGFEWQALGCCVCWNPHTHVMVDAAKQAPISGLCTHVLHNMPVPGTAAHALKCLSVRRSSHTQVVVYYVVVRYIVESSLSRLVCRPWP